VEVFQQETRQKNRCKPAQLRAVHLQKSFSGNLAVNDVCFYVQQGEVVGLLGPNGAGKTSSFYMMVGLYKPERGRVFLSDQEITSEPLQVRAKRGIGYLPQSASIFRGMSVRNNLLAVMELIGIAKNKRADLLKKTLADFGLTAIVNRVGAEISGGQRRRVEIARALIAEPKFLLLDEPFAGIDPITVQEIQKLLIELKKKNIGLLITDHNVRETLSCCDRAYVMAKGKIIAEGSPKSILTNNKVCQIYLGQGFSNNL
jgi:lipopolysaccharide export system ATP-binding protein